MSETFVVYSPLSGIALHGIDELKLGRAKLLRNPASVALVKNGLAFDTNALVASDLFQSTSVTIRPDRENEVLQAPFGGDVARYGVAKYLVEVEIETPTNELSGQIELEELEWAVLPLRLLTPARILTGCSEYCRGGAIHSGLRSGIRDTVYKEGVLLAPPTGSGFSVLCTVTAQAAEPIAELARVLETLRPRVCGIERLRVAIETFTKSFYLPSYTRRGMDQLIALESLFKPEAMKKGIRDWVVGRALNLLLPIEEKSARGPRRQMRESLESAFNKKKDIEHGKKGVESTEEFFERHINSLDNVVRQCLLQAMCLLAEKEHIGDDFPGLAASFQ